jgi:FecR protein
MTSWKIPALWKNAAVLFASVFLIAGSAVAQEVGTATAVNPLSESTPPGGSTRTLTIGAHVLHQERINTSPAGSVQLLFLDHSSLSLAPNTSIVIDDFVYDPNSGNGHMLATLTHGALRYVGGALSHEGETTIKTANAAIGIRGGTDTITQGPNGTTVTNHHGTVTISNNVQTITFSHWGLTVTITGLNIPFGQPAQATAAEIDHYIKILTSQFGQHGSGPEYSLNGFQCGAPSAPPCPVPPWLSTNTGQNNADQIIIQATQHGTGQTPPPPPPPPMYR